MLLAIHLVMTGLSVLLGVVFASGKGTGLIAGYGRGKSKLRQKEALQGHVAADVRAGRVLAGHCVERGFQGNRSAVDLAGAVSCH